MYDVAVVGLGAAGAMTAWRAAARGASVLGVERFGPAHARGSSHGASRIFRETLFEGVDYRPVIARAKALWGRLATESGATLFRRSGGLTIGPGGSGIVPEALRAAAAGGFAHAVLEPDELSARFPQHLLLDGDVAVFEPGAGVLAPETAIRAALDRAAADGADLRFHSAVTGLLAADDRVLIDLGGERLQARTAVVATGAWLTDLVPMGALRVQRSPLAHFTGPDRAGYRPERFPVFVRESGDLDGWGIPDVDGRGVKIGAGGSAKPWLRHADDNDRPLDERDTGPAEEFCRRALPGLTPVVASGRPCMNLKSPDGDFVLGASATAPRLLLAGGFSGHGFKHAAGVGDIMADLALDGATDVDLGAFSPDRPELHVTRT